MVKSPLVAKRINELMLDISDRIRESVASTGSECSVEEQAAYERAAARVVATIEREVLSPLYAEQPALRPAGWKVTTVSPAGESRSLGGIIQPV